MKMRHRKIYALLLTAVLAGTGSSTILAQTPTGVRIHGSVFGGGNEADVKINTTVNIGGGTIDANVYGGGNLGDVGRIDKTDQTNYNYTWTLDENGNSTSTYNNTGVCTVTITGGTIGGENISTADHASGHVFGAGKGSGVGTYYCEQGMVYKTNVSISKGTVYGNVYGGGEVGRVENNATVKIGPDLGDDVAEIKGSVFGAGAGLETHGYSALVRNNTDVTIQGHAKVRNNVYGGGEIAAVGRYWVKLDPPMAGAPTPPDGTIVGMPYQQRSGGVCTVIVKGQAEIGPNEGAATDLAGHVFGGGKGVTPNYVSGTSQKMTPSGDLVGFTDDSGKTAEQQYYEFLETLALVTNTSVTIGDNTADDGDVKVKGSVFGGSENGFVQHNTSVSIQKGSTIGTDGSTYGNVYGGGKGLSDFAAAGRVSESSTVAIEGGTIWGSVYGGGTYGYVKENVTVNVTGGEVKKDVYGGGALAHTNTANWTGSALVATYPYHEVTGLTVGTSDVTGLYTTDGSTYTAATGTAAASTIYYRLSDTKVRLTGGKINGKAYGGGRGEADTPAFVYGNVLLDLNGETALGTDGKPLTTGTTIASTAKGCVVDQIFGCNNVNGTPKGNVTVHVYATQNKAENTTIGSKLANDNDDKLATDDATLASVTADELKPILKDFITKGTTLNITVTSYQATYDNASVTANDLRTAITGLSEAINAKLSDKNTSADLINAYNALVYDVKDVYGGGNEAAYIPVYDAETGVTAYKTQVIIEGCEVTSIETVYGGGNAAAVPETNVEVKSAHEIENVFAGGNGKDRLSNGAVNPGADVGVYKIGTTSYDYGSGNANASVKGGYIHQFFGASNEKGTIKGNTNQQTTQDGTCNLKIGTIYGAGRNADIEGNQITILSCQPTTKVPYYYGGAENANVKGNVELTITNGWFGKVFAGNNINGSILGHVKVNIEETGCNPIRIDELYGCGNDAAYSVYGYYVKTSDANGIGANTETPVLSSSDKLVLLPRTSADDRHLPVTSYTYNDGTEKWEWETSPIPEEGAQLYDDPEVNVISATYIGKVFGGGYGENGTVYGNPMVNINQIYGTPNGVQSTTLGEIGDVFGGGNAASVVGDATVNIGMKTEVRLHQSVDANGNYTMNPSLPASGIAVLGANITGSVFGGGNEADVTGDTHVNICGTQEQDPNPGPDSNGYTDNAVDHSGTAGFNVSIGKSVYGGGNKANVLGNTFVTMADGYVFNGIFGGGYSGSVGTFTTSTDVTDWGHTANHTGCSGKPTACTSGGTCYVVVSGGQIGPVTVATEGMTRMTSGHGDPIPQGWVWGGGCGIVENPSDDQDTHFKTYVNNTDVTIKDKAFILESIIGGGEFGRVLGNTLVKIKGGQIGVGYNQTETVSGVVKPKSYTAAQWTEAEAAVLAGDASRINTIATQMPACSHFPYGRNDGTEASPIWVYDTYDPFADLVIGEKPYPGGSTDKASDGKTWIGCVFAGGSGYMPYTTEDGEGNITGYDWVKSAGWVEGNAEVRISGGHILTNVYGGNENTDVKGKCIVKMSGGTVGVPLTLSDKMNNPMTGNIYGAGKGDPRVHFNKVTNIGDAEIEITGGIVYGSVYGGGEDGHVLRDVTMTIGKDDHTGPIIGTWGTTYVDGNVFGGGRGFSGDAYTAGNVAGSVKLDIKGGTILGSVYGGGRLGSVGYGLFDEGADGYGKMRADSDTEEGFSTEGFFSPKGRGHIDITISGGTIGNNYEYVYNPTAELKSSTMPLTEFDSDNHLMHTKGGNVFAGGMGRMYQLDGKTAISAVDWWKMGNVKSTKLTISGDAKIYSNVYGGGELGMVQGGTHTTSDGKDVSTEIIIKGGTIGKNIEEGGTTKYTFGSVFGGGYGSLVEKLTHTGGKPDSYPKYIAGRVKGSTSVTISDDAKVKASIYGGGEMAAVGESKVLGETLTEGLTTDTYVTVSGGTIGESGFGGAKMGNVYGGGSGHNNTVRSGHIYGNTNVTISDGTIYHNIYGGGAYGTVGDFVYDTRDVDGAPKVFGVTGIHEDHVNTGVATVTITGGTMGVDGHENGMVFGSSRGDINKPGERDDHTAWVYDANVIIGNNDGSGPQINGSVYGSGENGHTFHNTNVNMLGGTIGIASGSPVNGQSGAAYPYRGNVYGGGCGTDKYYSGAVPDGHKANDGNGDTYNPLAGIVYGDATVNIKGGTVVRNVYGAGAMGSVNKKDAASATGGKTTVIVSGGHVGVDGNDNGHVFGAARGDLTVTPENYATVRTTEVSVKSNADIKGSVFGGGEAGLVWENVTVNMLGGSVAKDVYGGGALANTQAANNNEGNTTSTFKTTVNVLGGTVNDVYGGGLGQVGKAAVAAQGTPGEEGYVPAQAAVTAVEAKVYGDVTVNLNGLESANYVEADHGSLVTDIDPTDGTYYRATDGCIVTGNVFGCNNVNGTPEGHAKVHVFKTVSAGHEHGYDVTNVFGGGNQADYVPKATETKQSTEVIIEGCDLTKIQQVYGGGNAAATPGTLVLIKGTKIIDEVFGGGNGFSATDNHTDPTAENYNPGANVGYHTDKSEYKDSQGNYIGDGKSLVQLMAGTVNYVYGGSNSEGDIRGGSSVTNVKNDNSHGCCDKMTVKEIYAGGKNANMKGGANIVMGCYNSNDWIEEIYAGAKNANVGGDVSLTLTSGKYGRVFGGNKESGILDGSITVNIEENGVCGIPLIIGELYGGGNKAPYSIYGYNSDGTVKTSASGTDPHASPVVNVRGFTSIGNIFGGGYGEKAVMYGSPTININEAAISHTNLDNVYANGYAGETIHFVNDVLVKTVPEGTDPSTVYSVAVPAHDNGKMGTINNVFGGGNAAAVYGDTNVNIGTTASEKLVNLKSSGDPDYENDTNGNPTTTPKRTEKTVVGADIRGNVYGGGNKAEVTGNTNVNIGKATTTTTP